MNVFADPDKPSPAKTETAVFAGGCFWCTQASFETRIGVKSAICGYTGGATENPTYQEVCNGQTGHAEAVLVEFDPAKISYEKLVDFFWKIHDPTTLNQQGADHGTQYRSAIFYRDEAQKLAAEKSKKAAADKFTETIVTEIVPLAKFYPAEEYHQNYFKKHPDSAYCQAVIQPKLEKIKSHP